ncbi:MAG: hypothetical protein WD045_17990 [Pirellulaceae bacterium]
MEIAVGGVADRSASSISKPSPEARLQSLFSEILIQQGRPGYASAEAHESEQPLDEQVQTAWSSWFGVETGGRYAQDADPATLKREYGDLLTRALEEEGYYDPESFLQTLSGEELEVVQMIHRLADPIDLAQLDEEGMLNLMLPPPAQIDLNFDGLTRVGLGFMIRFPDSRTPPAVVEAWNEATAELSPREKMTFQLQMKLPTLLANFVLNEDGSLSHARQPGDPDFVNPMASPDYSYLDLTGRQLESLELFKYQMQPERYESQTAFWTSFQQALADHGAS